MLLLAESLPWPPVKGGDLRTWQNLNILSAYADVGIFGLCSNDARAATPPPQPFALWRSSTDPALTYPPPKGVRLAGRAWLFEPRGHPSDLFHSPVAQRELEQLLDEFRPHAVVLEGLWLHGYLASIRARGCRVILDCHNIEAVLSRQLAASTAGQDFESRVIRDVVPERTELIEGAAVGAVDQLWVCSADDARELRERYQPTAPIAVIPNGLRLEDYAEVAATRAQSAGAAALTVLYHGLYSYFPNTRAAALLAGAIFPQLAAAAAAPCRLELVGPMPTAAMLAAAARDARIVVPGAVPDVRPWLAGATVLAVPLRHGSGTRLKVLEAFAAGLPVVSTARGAEGLLARPDTHLLVAESEADFVAALLSVWRDPDGARRRAAAARELVAERYSWAAIQPGVHAALGQLVPLEAQA